MEIMEKRGRNINKKSQVTVFIVLAIFIIAILALLLFREQVTEIFVPKSPVEQIEGCTQEFTKEGLEILKFQGGTIEPENYYLYQDNKIDYLCYTQEYYKKCVMQIPLLKEHIETQLVEYIRPNVNECINDLKTNLERQGYSVSYKEPLVLISLVPENVLMEIELDLNIAKDTTESYKTIKTNIPSNMYNFAMIASSISNWEARYGDTEILNYMLYYPDLKVEKKKQNDGTTIYILTDRETQDQFWFASRSVVFPPGVTGT